MWNAASRQFFLDQAKPYPYATGGDYVYLYEDPTTGKTYRVHEFLSTGTSTLNVEVGGQMEYLIVGGGGGGGRGKGGGGGGGGALIGSTNTTKNTNYTIQVGAGGTGAIYSPATGSVNGGDSSFDGNVAYGGGNGGYNWTIVQKDGGSGGCGGGGVGVVNSTPGIGGTGTADQGNAGGSGSSSSSSTTCSGGGGGGAGETGQDASVGFGGNGGSGIEWPNNSSRYYGGGGGGYVESGTAGIGGTGGGGDGATSTNDGQNGETNTGGGGGGGGGSFLSNGGNGGSGIVIVRYVVAEKKLWTPSELGSSLVGWWDATEISGLSDDSTVSTWNDISGSGYDVSISGTGNDVIYKTNILNSLPIVRFQSDKVLQRQTSGITASRNASSNMLVAVARMRDVASARADIVGVVSSVNTNNFLCGMDFHRTANKHCSIIRRTGNDSPSTPSSSASYSAGTWYIRVSTMDYANSGRISQYVDGTQDPSASSELGGSGNSEDSDNNSIKIGGFNTASGSEDVDIAETLILKDNISLTDRQKLEGYLAHKWGLTNNLPSGHPYKYEPPYKVEPEEIVTDGLVLNLDAGDYASYPRSGITWYDISGNGLNGTLTNGPTYDSANKGSIVFDGTNDYNLLPNLALSYPFTISLWSKGSSIIIFSDPTVDNKSIALGGFFSGGVNVIRCHYYSPATGYIAVEEPANSTTIYNICGVFTSSGFDLYVNGQYKSTLSGAKSKVWTDTLGSYNMNRLNRPSVIYYSGNSYACQIYNRALSSTEITQNFNALRGRYGI